MDTQPRRPVIIDMTPEGEFRDPPPASRMDRLLARAGGVAALVATLAVGLTVAALALAALTVLIPIAIGGALVAWAAFRWRMYRLRRQGRAPAQTGTPLRFVILRR